MADDQVVEDLDVEEAPGGERLGRQVQVVRRRGRVARRVVVDQDDASRVEPDRVAEQLTDTNQRRGHVALVDRRDAQDVVLRVEHDHAQLLALETAHLEDQPVCHVVRAADRPACRGPVRQQPSSELEGGHQLGGLGRTDPVDLDEFQVRRTGEPGQPVVAHQRVRRQVHGRAPARPGTPDETDQLGRREPADAAHGQPLARPLGGGQLADRAPASWLVTRGHRERLMGSGHQGTSIG